MTKLEIIEETVNFYLEDVTRRAFRYGSCYYYFLDDNEQEKKCAVGRCLIDPKYLQEEIANNIPYGQIDRVIKKIEKPIDELFLPEYRGYTVKFWVDLQKLHDKSEYWNRDSLTFEGKTYLNTLNEKYA